MTKHDVSQFIMKDINKQLKKESDIYIIIPQAILNASINFNVSTNTIINLFTLKVIYTMLPYSIYQKNKIELELIK